MNVVLVRTGIVLASCCLWSCGQPDKPAAPDDLAEAGVVTTLREVQRGDFRIVDEHPTPLPADSRLIVEYLDRPTDTLTLAEAQAIAAAGDTTRTESRAVRRAGMGFFGYLMLGRMMGGINRGAYINNSAYNRARQQTGTRLNNNVRRSTGPRRNSGFGRSSGGSRSTRSFGG